MHLGRQQENVFPQMLSQVQTRHKSLLLKNAEMLVKYLFLIKLLWIYSSVRVKCCCGDMLLLPSSGINVVYKGKIDVSGPLTECVVFISGLLLL